MLLLLLSHFSRVQLCATPWTAAHQAPLSVGFSRQEYWSGVPSPFQSGAHRDKLLRLCWVVTVLRGGDLGFSLEWVALSVWIVGSGSNGRGMEKHLLSSLPHWLQTGPLGHALWVSGWWLQDPHEVLLVLDSSASIGKPGRRQGVRGARMRQVLCAVWLLEVQAVCGDVETRPKDLRNKGGGCGP